jgi:hypothetical protein
MKSAEQIEQSIRRLDVEGRDETRERTRRDLIRTHTQCEGERPRPRGWSLRRTILTIGTRKLAATVVLAVLLVAALDLSTGSVARSQTHHVVSATLAWLRSMIVGGEAEAPPARSSRASQGGERRANPNLRVVACAAHFYRVPADNQGVWQSLQDQGIELVAVSTDPEVYYATLSREQAESINDLSALECISAPRVTAWEGDTTALAVTNTQPSGLALGWLPTVSSDGKEVQSTISLHDGRRGFELPNVGTESGGVVLLRVKGMFPGPNQDRGDPGEVLIRLQMDIQ